MTLAIGTQLGSLEITALLGKGGMGEVYRARDFKLKREVAVKILPEEFSRDADRVSRFQREAEVLASLSHPNIAGIHDLQEANGSRYLVLELVEGETLADRLRRGPIPFDEAVAIAKRIVDALEAAHERAIVHRDLKPGNIKRTPEGTVKVLDFGLAKTTQGRFASDQGFSNSPTLMSGSMGGVIIGTAPYMSPEQARGKTVDARTDIWAFGCVLYEMLTGQQTFAGETTTDVLAKVLEAQPKWDALPAETPSSIRFLLETALNKVSKQRLQHIGDARPLLNRPATLDKSTTVRAQGSRRGWIVAAAALLLALAASVPGGLYFMRAPADLPVLRFEMPAPGFSSGLAISPDGQRIAYVATNGGKQAIWIRALGSLTAQPLAGTENGTSPFWAPDSRHLAFYADGKLKKTDVSAGGVQILGNSGPLTVPGAWSKEGMILFGAMTPSPGIYRIPDAGGGDPVLVTSAPDTAVNSIQFVPVLLPDGRHFLFHTADGSNGNVYLGSLDSKSVTHLMGLTDFKPGGTSSPATYAQGYFLFSRDRTLFVQPFDVGHGKLVGDPVPIAENAGRQFSVSSTGILVYRSDPSQSDQNETAPSRFTWFDRKGKPAGELNVPTVASDIALSADGRIAMDNIEVNAAHSDVWVIDSRGVPNKLTADNPNLDAGPVWSPDGQHIVFSSSREQGLASAGLYQRSSNGVGAAELLFSSGLGFFDIPKDWFGGGIVFERTEIAKSQVSSDIWVLSMPEKKPSSYLRNGFANAQAQLSPDRRYIAYVTNEPGSYQVVVRTFPDPNVNRWQITSQGGSEPLWSSDGRELYYLAPNGKIMAVAVKTEPTFQALQQTELFQTVLTPQPTPRIRRYAVSRDGQRFLIAPGLTAPTAVGNSAPIIAVVNWTSAITKK